MLEIIFGIICLALGALNIFLPELGWYLNVGWKFRDAEPSDAALTMTRVGGIIAVIIGFVFFFQ